MLADVVGAAALSVSRRPSPFRYARPVPTRRTLLGAAPVLAASLTGSLASGTARAQTPRDVAVMAKQIDDVISLDPAESFEHSGDEIGGNAYQRLPTPG